ncbi:PEPxxWA-CTERM sorting domain-containing protein [Sphingomonas sp. GB1N7]
MRRSITTISWILPLLLAAAPAGAATVIDATGDFLPTYTGPQLADLDVTSFSVNFDPISRLFTLGATFAGAIDPTTGGAYIFGVNTGTGTIRPFAAIGQANVIFNQAITVNKNGTGTLGGVALNPADIAIAGNILTLKIAASLLPSTGFAPEQYGFNLWPRLGAGNSGVTDFSPENATLSVASAVPEPASWGMMILGFATIGAGLRSRGGGRRRVGLAA